MFIWINGPRVSARTDVHDVGNVRAFGSRNLSKIGQINKLNDLCCINRNSRTAAGVMTI